MAYILEDSVKTTLAANVSAGASSIDVNKSSNPWNDVPDPSGNTSPLTLTDSTTSPGKIEIITYTSRTDNGDGTYTLSGVTKDAHGSHGDQAWSSGDVALQGPLVTPDQWGGKTIGDLVQYEDDGTGSPHVKLPNVSQQDGNNIIDVSNLAANGGTVPETDRTNIFSFNQTVKTDGTATSIELDNTPGGGQRWDFRSVNNEQFIVSGDGSGTNELSIDFGGGIELRNSSNNVALSMDSDGLVRIIEELIKAEQGLGLVQRSSDPADPPAGESVEWISDGTGSGDDGDIMRKVSNSSGTTKIETVFDFSAS